MAEDLTAFDGSSLYPNDYPNGGPADYYGNPHFVPKSQYDKLKDVTFKTLGLTVDRVKNELLGMNDDLVDPSTGKGFEDSAYEQFISVAAASAEKEFDIVITPRVVKERVDYNEADFNSYSYLRLSQRPIIQVDDIQMMFNNQSFLKYPDRWIKVSSRFGQVQLLPDFLFQQGSPNSAFSPLSFYPATYPAGFASALQSSYATSMFAPQMLGVTYIAGMLPPDPKDVDINREWYIQPDLISYIAKQAAIEVLERWGRLILGAGIASFSTNVDGISSSIDSTQSAENTGSTADIKLLQEDSKILADGLHDYYGINLGIIS